MNPKAGLVSFLSVSICFLSLSMPSASAGWANVETFPDIKSDTIGVQYIASTGSLTARGLSSSFNDGANEHSIAQFTPMTSTFELDATFDNLGQLQSGGTLRISGTIADLAAGPVLLTGSLTDFNNYGAGLIAFLFDVTGGSLATYYGGAGGVGFVNISAGVIPTLGPPWSNFSNLDSYNGTSDAQLVTPEPSSIMLALSGAAFAVGLAWRRRSAGRNTSTTSC